MDIVIIIASFLRRYGRAEVPSFGVFYLGKGQAKLDQSTGHLLPPAREVRFEEGDLEGGNLLADHVAEKQGVSRGQALTLISEVVTFWKANMAEKRSFSLEGLGKFVFLEERLRFEGERVQDETPDFYGLEEINLHQLKRKTSPKSTEYQIKNALLWAFLLILPLGGFLILAFTQREMLFGKLSFPDRGDEVPIHREQAQKDSLKRDSTEAFRLGDSLQVKDSLR
ncbi:hypothetical protein [Bergeyella sp. RCAD1439]|uniref:hypothetical protein n=1 Tax=Bergeyella anatis TaxID=3113737 RepID=UPI002E17BDE0|nr:hypothetical protein [Bergeyella sp. RCAD1439]